MAEIKWTEGQQNAINHNDGSMIVTAAAGSGKTAVIVARVLRLVKTTDIDRLVIVTFTNAAAQQMRDKLSEGLIDAIKDEKTSDADKKNYQRQLLLLPGANICTVHSFCMRLIKENFDKLDISPNFGICDNAQRSMLFDKATQELLEECYEDDAFRSFAQKFITSKSDNAEEYTKEIYRASRKVPFPSKWLDMVLESYKNYKNSAWYSFLVKDIKDKVADAVKEYREYVENYVFGIEELQIAKEMAVNDTVQFTHLTQDANYEQLYNVLSKASFERLNPKINKIDTEKNISSKRDEFKKIIEGAKPELSPSELESFMSLQYENLKMFVSLAEKLDEKYNEKKKKAQLLEFDDLEHLAIKLLCDEEGKPTELAKELSLEYDEIIIDEYQDTNDIQETIFTAISRNKENLFMVGDMKQSIYSFRNTEPDLFLEKAKKYGNHDGGTRGILSSNFRSRANILSYVNHVFENIMSEDAGEVNYDKDEKLYFGNRDFDVACDNCVDLYVLDETGLSDLEAECLKISEIIQKLIENEYVTDKKTGQLRKVQYSDIAILSRRAQNPIPKITEMLTKQGIPTSSDVGGSMFLETYEVSLVLSYLKILDNPYQDIPLVTVLRCPVYKISDDLLTEISRNKGTFYEKLLKVKDRKELYPFFRDYNELRDMCSYSRCGEIVSYILNKLGVMDFVSNMPGGEQRRVNLEYLQKYAFDFDGEIKKTLSEFITYTDNMQKYSGEVVSPKYMPENLNAVTVMSMHKSKGLEFPVVILEGLGDTYAMREKATSVISEKSLGLGFDLMDAENFRKISSPVSSAIKKYLKNKALSEELRILYVAMTRAKEKLIMVGTAKDEKLKELVSKGVSAVTANVVKRAKTYLDFVILGSADMTCFETDEYISEGIKPHKKETDIKFNFIRQSLEEFAKEAEENLTQDTEETQENPEVNRRLEYEYPSKESYYTKYTVSELKKLEGEEISPYYQKLASLYEEESGANRGTLIHKVFENTDPKKVEGIESIENLPEGINAEEIYAFFATDVGRLLKESDEIYKEAPFIIADERGFLVQGVIDCYFKSVDKYIIVDYKSDNICDKNKQERVDMYSIQLEYYKKAVKKIHSAENVDAYIYFTKTKEIIKI